MLRTRSIACALLAPALLLSACGSKTKNVNTASYTCADFNKSLETKNDSSAGNYINALLKQGHLKAGAKTGHREVTLGIYFACRNKPGTTKPAAAAIATAKRIESGTFKLPPGPKPAKKSNK